MSKLFLFFNYLHLKLVWQASSDTDIVLITKQMNTRTAIDRVQEASVKSIYNN